MLGAVGGDMGIREVIQAAGKAWLGRKPGRTAKGPSCPLLGW